MNAEQFVIKVDLMRKAQTAYFRDGRKQSDLIKAKQLEKEVDLALLEGISFPVEGVLLDEGEQIGLFEENDNEATTEDQ